MLIPLPSSEYKNYTPNSHWSLHQMDYTLNSLSNDLITMLTLTSLMLQYRVIQWWWTTSRASPTVTIISPAKINRKAILIITKTIRLLPQRSSCTRRTSIWRIWWMNSSRHLANRKFRQNCKRKRIRSIQVSSIVSSKKNCIISPNSVTLQIMLNSKWKSSSKKLLKCTVLRTVSKTFPPKGKRKLLPTHKCFPSQIGTVITTGTIKYYWRLIQMRGQQLTL